LNGSEFVGFSALFTVEEGRMGVTVTFIAVLELMREGLLELVQAEGDGIGPLHVRPAQGRPFDAANDAAQTPTEASEPNATVTGSESA
jgi:segregation and condensation protein A